MALLQAARAQALGYPLDEAESLGLNQAIFYAAAKRGFQGGTGSKHAGEQHVLREAPGGTTKTVQQDALGDEVAYYVEMVGKKRYVMGDEIQEPGDFNRQVAERVGFSLFTCHRHGLLLFRETGTCEKRPPPFARGKVRTGGRGRFWEAMRLPLIAHRATFNNMRARQQGLPRKVLPPC
jgi:hypothetical protein